MTSGQQSLWQKLQILLQGLTSSLGMLQGMETQVSSLPSTAPCRQNHELDSTVVGLLLCCQHDLPDAAEGW